MITLETKAKAENGGTFFRFRLDPNIQFWFVLFNKKDIYNVSVCPITNIFPLTRASFYSISNKEGNYISGFEVSTVSLNGKAHYIEGCLNELASAKEIIVNLTRFFCEDFREKYMQEV